MSAKWLLLACMLISLRGCAGGIGFAPRPSVAPAPPGAPSPVVSTPTPTDEKEPAVTLMGTVMEVSMSARIILLERAAQGFRLIALSEQCKLATTGGEAITLRDIRPGMTVQASGRPGESEALIAEEVLVALSTPIPSGPTAAPAVPTAASGVPEGAELGPLDLQPRARDVQRIQFAEGVTRTTVAGTLAQDGVSRYILRVMAGQRMILDLRATGSQVSLGLAGDDGQVLLSGRVAGSRYDGIMPITQDYTIWIGANGEPGIAYTLAITLPPL